MERKKKKVEPMDIISNLPDHIIIHIISYLPTEEAVRTCILSLRWRYLWKGINRISLLGPESDPDKFTNLANHVLDNCSSSNLLSFELSCPDKVDLSRVNSWISNALGSKIEKLNLCVSTLFPGLPTLAVLPECILACSKLVVVKLDSFFDIHIPDSVVCFPHLKSLHLDLILPYQCNVMHRLFSSCPVLGELCLSGHLDSGDVLKFDICVPTLRKLTLGLEFEGFDHTNEYVITIDTPNLQYLSIMDDSFSRYLLRNLLRVRYVDIMYEAITLESIEPKHVESLLELLKGIAAAELLTLHFHTMDVLASAVGYTWPIFPNLMTLEVFLHDLSGWTCFPSVLHTAPNLKVLILDLEAMHYMDDDSDDDEHPNPKHQWTAPESVPPCFLEHLRIIGVKGFEGNKDELQAIKFLLSNAQGLERMLIGFNPCPVNEEAVERLLTFPRASKLCDVQVYDRVCSKTTLINSQSMITVWGM